MRQPGWLASNAISLHQREKSGLRTCVLPAPTGAGLWTSVITESSLKRCPSMSCGPSTRKPAKFSLRG
jgi:hypothetical protein